MRNSALEKAAVKKVKSEIDTIIDNARSQLQVYIEDESDIASLKEVSDSLTQIERTLQLVQINGAAVLAREMRDVVDCLIEDSITQTEKAQETLSRGILQMSDYLEYVQVGNKDVPIVLLPLLNDLRGVREAALLSEHILFFPNLDDIEVPNVNADFGMSAQEYAKKIRYGFQSGLISLIQNKETDIAATKICKVAIRLHQCSKQLASQRLWWVSSAVAQALAIGSLPTSAGLASLLGQVDRQIKNFVGLDEVEFANNIPSSLIKNLLYYVGIAGDRGRIVTKVKTAYSLNDLIPSEDVIGQMREGIAGPNVEVLQAVSKALHEDIATVKDAIELYVHNENRSPESVSQVGEQLHKIADTLSMVGLEEPREEVMREVAALNGLSADELEHADDSFVHVAETLIKAENIVENFVNYRLLNKPVLKPVEDIDDSDKSVDGQIEDNQLKKIKVQTISEALSELEEAKNAVSQVLASPNDETKLQEAQDRFRKIIGALSILRLDDVAAILENIQAYLIGNQAAEELNSEPTKLDAFADSVTSVECYLEAIIAEEDNPADILSYGLESVSRLVGAEVLQTNQVNEVQTIKVDNLIEDNSESLSLVDVETNDVGKKKTEISEEVELEDLSATSLGLSIDPELFDQPPPEVSPDPSNIKNEITADTELSLDISESTDMSLENEAATELNTSLQNIENDEDELSPEFAGLEETSIFEAETELSSFVGEVEDKDLTIDLNQEGESVGVVEVDLEENDLLNLNEIEEELNTNVEKLDLDNSEQQSSGDLPSIIDFVDEEVQEEKLDETQLQPTDALEPDNYNESDQETGTIIEDLDISESVELTSEDLPALTEQEIENYQLTEEDKSQLSPAEIVRSDKQDSGEYIISLTEDGVEKELQVIQQDADSEIIEIFVEEAEEEIEKITQTLPAWRSNPDNEEALISIRRSFHTLKGSGRLIGAQIIGEYSWQLEKLLNKVIESTLPVTDELHEVLAQSVTALQQLVEQLKSDQQPKADIQALITSAQQFSAKSSGSNKLLEDSSSVGEGVKEVSENVIDDAPSDSSQIINAAKEAESLEDKDKDEDLNESNIENDFATELREIFINEASQHVAVLEDLVDKGAETKKLKVDEAMLHALHTLHGSARTADVGAIVNVCKPLEQYCQDFHKKNQVISEAQFDTIVACVQHIKQVITEHSEDLQAANVDSELLSKVDELKCVEIPVLEDFVDSTNVEQEIDLEETQFITIADTNITDEKLPENIDLYEDKDADLVEIFLEEASDILSTCNECLDNWREDPEDQNSISELRRQLHTLKGSARMATYTNIGDFSHAIESVVIPIAEGVIEATGPVFSLLQRCLDSVHEMVDDAVAHRPVYPAENLIAELNAIKDGNSITGKVDAVDSENNNTISDKKPDSEKSTLQSESKPVVKIPVLRSVVKPKEQQSIQPVIAPQQSVRLQAEMLDNLVNNAGEVNIFQARLEQVSSKYTSSIKELEQIVDRVRDQLRNLEIETETQILSRHAHEAPNVEDFDPLELDRYSTIQQLSRSLAESVNDLLSIKEILFDQVRESEILLLQQHRINSDLQEGLMRTRMVQFSQLVPRMQRIVRQTARELDKDADLKVIGAQTEVDSSILNRIVAPLEHLIRNAISHGIEDKTEREKTGKPESGEISISVSREGAEIVIEVTDDGAGIDPGKVKKKALELGLIENVDIPERELLDLILAPGFSTAGKVTQVSGRGVGMDVVANELKQLGGFLKIDSELGKGAVFTIRIPFTLAIAQALLIKCGDETYATPLVSVEGVVRLSAHELKQKYAKDNATYHYADKDYRLCHLGTLLSINQPQLDGADNMFPVLLVRSGDSRMALHVEATLGNREIVVKPLASQLSRLPAVSGATILGDGSVVLILDVQGLIRLDSIEQLENAIIPGPETSKGKKPTVLVVDDSITIRKVTKRFLERNNFKVVTAKDGIDAVQALQDFTPDMILLDIEMPRMDGYELAAHVRNNTRLKNVPIIMITSRTGEKHRQRAFDIGVQEYLGKPYNENELLRNIEAVLH